MGDISLSRITTQHSTAPPSLSQSESALAEAGDSSNLPDPPPSGSRNVVEALDSYPDGGLGPWLQVVYCSFLFGTSVGGVYGWGVLQDALTELASPSSVAYIGSMQAASTGIFAILAQRLIAAYGPTKIAFTGALFMGIGPIIAGSFPHNYAAIFMTQGVMFGVGQALCFGSAATLPSSYFLKKRNLATGCTFAGGGIGGAVLSLLSSALIQRVGIPWTFRTLGLLNLAINIPASLALKSRMPRKPLRSGAPIVEWSLFKDLRFCLVFFGSGLGLFPLFVPPFFLPSYATTLGLSPTTGSLLLAGFNLASSVGRIGFGLGADRYLGSVNSLVLCLGFVGITTLVIWPFATTLPPLAVFAVVNGIASGGFFSLMPGVISSLFGSSKLGLAFGMTLTGWSIGYFWGSPIAGFLLEAFGGVDAGFKAFQPAIFYSGALSLAACLLILAARITESKELWKKV
ncbi:MFS general substrate transporter [Meredithblackwellia eburnea MCA 4105]